MLGKLVKNDELSRPTLNQEITAVIEEGCEFEGKLSFEGTVRIGGKFKGEVYTKDTLVVAEGAHVEADIQSGVVVINGTVEGNINATSRVEIHEPAIFRGNIRTPSLKVDKGVIFEGQSSMTGPDNA
jgi:cytoskeletal protein CcmA (bactofilin family)